MNNIVNIQGVDIELPSIENALNTYPTISQAMVKVFEDEFGHKRLIAYVVKKSAEILNSVKIRRFLQEKLPKYSVPNTIMEIDHLPLNDDGDLDRKMELPLPINTLEVISDNVPPGSEIEVKIMELCSSVFSENGLGINDNLMDVKNDITLFRELTRQIQESLKVNLTVFELLSSPTVYQLSRLVEKKKALLENTVLESA